MDGVTHNRILGDPGADKGGEGKSKRAEKYDTKKSKDRREEPIFTFLRVIFFRPFRLSLVPTICPWVSEDGTTEASMILNDFPFIPLD